MSTASGRTFPVLPDGTDVRVLADALLTSGDGVYGGPEGRGGLFKCPVHDDGDRPNLNLAVGDRVPAIVTCQVCLDEFDSKDYYVEVLDRLGLDQLPDVRADPEECDWGPKAESVGISFASTRLDWSVYPEAQKRYGAEFYPFPGADGERYGLVVRDELYDRDGNKIDKRVRPYHYRPDAAPGGMSDAQRWGWGGELDKAPVEVRRYVGKPWRWKQRWPDLDHKTPMWWSEREQWQGKTLHFPEGEKDAARLRSLGLQATTYPFGHCPDSEALREHVGDVARIVLYGDLDRAGFSKVRKRGKAAKVAGYTVVTRFVDREIYENATGRSADKADVSDWLDAGLDLKEMVKLRQVAEAELVSTPQVRPQGGRDDGIDPLDGDEDTEFSDARLAYHFAEEFEHLGKPVIFSAGLGWLRWTGKRWKPTDADTIRGKVMDFALDWLRDLAGVKGKSHLRDRVARLLNNSRADKIVRAMQALIRAELTDFDAHPDLLNCQNGVVDLRTGELQPHDPALLLTKITRVAYKPEARGEVHDWEKAKEALPLEVCEYLLDRLGQATTGYPPGDDKMLFDTGSGGNGKSTLLEPVRLCLGDYAAMVPQKLLLANPNEHPTELMTLRGLRLAVVEELPESARMNTQRLKTIVGTGAITARLMRKDFVTFAPTHALIVNTNHAPNVIETDHGTWRRLERINFAREYRHGGVDETLRERVKRQAGQEAALADLVWSAQRYYANGRLMPRPPEAVQEATAQWRTDSDDVLTFFNDRLEADPDAAVSMADVLSEFNQYLAERGGNRIAWGDKLLVARLTANESLPVRFEKGRGRKYVLPNGLDHKASNPVAVWKGVRFRRD